MGRCVRNVKLAAGLLACLFPGCLHCPGWWARPTAAKKPAASSNTTAANAPGWPILLASGQEFQNGPPNRPPAAGNSISPYHTSSLMTYPPDQGNLNQRLFPQTPGLLGSGSDSLLAPHAVADVHLEPGRTSPPPPFKDDRPPAAAEEPFVLALHSLWNDKPDEALEYLKRYDPANQEALICLTTIVARLTKQKLDQLSPSEVAALEDQLQKTLLSPLRPRAKLVIGKMCLCERIFGYEDYQPLPPDYEFQPRQDVQVYVPLRNLTCKKDRDGYETRVHCTMRIVDGTGKVMPFGTIEREKPSRTQTPVPDYFKSYTFYMPQLPPGQYTLAIEITDLNRPELPRSAKAALKFLVGSSGAGS
jgi:hypothetical protein